ncbi:MAG: hypothetical protein DSY53_02570 [Persephonella sp.]|nr:MAG: hypothetical protein DSY53_02570 [Persephonella sp.]
MSQIIVSPSRKHPDDIEIEELLERKNAKIQRKVQRPPLDVSDHCLGESGRETNFEDFEIAELDGTLKTFYACARKNMYMCNL